jgi:hypothetical protein
VELLENRDVREFLLHRLTVPIARGPFARCRQNLAPLVGASRMHDEKPVDLII